MFKATTVEGKRRKIFIDMQINLSSCRNSDHISSLSRATILQMFFWEVDQNLQNSYFKTFWMHAKQKPVEYSPSGVLDPLMLIVAKGHTYLSKSTNLS